MVEIERVDIAEPLRAGLNAALDSPGVGRIDGIAFRVAGWFRKPRGSSKPKVRLHLAASPGAEPVHWDLREVQSHERTDVPCNDWEMAVGFEGYVDGVLLPRVFRVLISYRHESGEVYLIGEISGRRTFIVGAYEPRFQPIAVYHGGRMGSTAMMRALLSHHDVAAGNQHPFENNTAAYLSNISNLLLRPAQTRENSRLEWGDARRGWHYFTSNWCLSRDFQDDASIEATLADLMGPTADFARISIDRCYDLVAARTGKTGAKFLVEKQVRPDVVNTLLWLYPSVKLILLTRDPRDVVRSARDFNAKRAEQGFYRQFVDNDEEWIDLQSRLLCSFVDVFDNHPPADRLHVPFEEFMADTRGTLRRVCEFLDIDRSQMAIGAMERAVLEETPESTFHRTRPSGKEVGSWREAVSPAHARRIVRGAGPFMQRFGYEPGPGQNQEEMPKGSRERVAGPLLADEAAEPQHVKGIIRQRDEMERASEQAARAARAHERRANEMGVALNELGRHAETLARERNEAMRFATSLEAALEELTRDAIAERQARERLQAASDTYVASLRAAVAERDEALQATQVQVETLGTQAIAEREARERLQAASDTYVASLRAAVAERDEALQATRAQVEMLTAQAIAEREARERLQVDTDKYVASLRAELARRDEASRVAQGMGSQNAAPARPDRTSGDIDTA